MSNQGFGSFGHLAVRFFGALDPRGPAPDDEAWALARLVPGEQDLWRRMSGADRRHAIGVARDTIELLTDGIGQSGGGQQSGGGEQSGGGRGDPPGRDVVAAALLHDVGKVESGLGTFSRVAVTVLALAVGRDRLTVQPPEGVSQGRLRTRIREYLTHDRIGGRLLRDAGSDPVTFYWAEEHHLAPERWRVDRRVADALKAADGD